MAFPTSCVDSEAYTKRVFQPFYYSHRQRKLLAGRASKERQAGYHAATDKSGLSTAAASQRIFHIPRWCILTSLLAFLVFLRIYSEGN